MTATVLDATAPQTDEELLLAVRQGQTDLFSSLVLRWEQPLFRFVSRMMPRPEDARDICQETFLRILDKADRYREGSRFSTWMYQIALNLCRDQARRSKRWGKLLAPGASFDETRFESPVTESANGPAEEAIRSEQRLALVRAMQTLPAEQREVLVLKEYEGLKFREIAAIVGCPESTVKSRMYYGLNGVRQALQQQGMDSL
ncbi:MAG: sigma-70 family RNA polymerase sigma factor [Acidobacteriota bacterium]|nr:sigma-70 family RNA polymerase sigma factor [Acidobacteriota bacterium]MDH3784608.1 sigma-70 family RNA polymerase sigma factor [Acidobacteriota bacterium]